MFFQGIPAILRRLTNHKDRRRVLGLGIVDLAHGNLIAIDGKLEPHGNLVIQRALETINAEHISPSRHRQYQGGKD